MCSALSLGEVVEIIHIILLFDLFCLEECFQAVLQKLLVPFVSSTNYQQLPPLGKTAEGIEKMVPVLFALLGRYLAFIETIYNEQCGLVLKEKRVNQAAHNYCAWVLSTLGQRLHSQLLATSKHGTALTLPASLGLI